MTFRENFIRTITFNYPKWLHCSIHLNNAMWAVYKEELEEVVLKYPGLFNSYKKGDIDFVILASKNICQDCHSERSEES